MLHALTHFSLLHRLLLLLLSLQVRVQVFMRRPITQKSRRKFFTTFHEKHCLYCLLHPLYPMYPMYPLYKTLFLIIFSSHTFACTTWASSPLLLVLEKHDPKKSNETPGSASIQEKAKISFIHTFIWWRCCLFSTSKRHSLVERQEQVEENKKMQVLGCKTTFKPKGGGGGQGNSWWDGMRKEKLLFYIPLEQWTHIPSSWTMFTGNKKTQSQGRHEIEWFDMLDNWFECVIAFEKNAM